MTEVVYILIGAGIVIGVEFIGVYLYKKVKG